jgi:hypothetical protein
VLSNISTIIIIIISPQKSTEEQKPLQLLAISLDLRLLASSSRQQIVIPPGVIHHIFREAVFTPELIYPNGSQFYG